MTLRVLIVDDEPLAREGVALLLDEAPDVEIIGQCETGAEAVKAINRSPPDLVFLDIKMPRIGGFDVIRSVGPDKMPPVIFLTAYEEYALEAFRVHALDYLLKPLDPERFRDSLERARTELGKSSLAGQASKLRALLNGDALADDGRDRLVVRSNGHVYFLRPEHIIWVMANGDYVTLYADEKEHLVRDTMSRMEKRLRPQGFRRIHRSAIVNLEHITELIANDSGDYQVVLSNGTQLKLSRTYRDELYAAMKA
ncbi:MAG: LytTR family transcriptional regulator DNA-binding domain-containing protein [Pseudomonadota bacterium]